MSSNYPPYYNTLTYSNKKVIDQVLSELTKLQGVICIFWGGSTSLSPEERVFSDIDLWVVSEEFQGLDKLISLLSSRLDNLSYIDNGGFFPWLGHLITIIFFPGSTLSIDVCFCMIEELETLNPGPSPYFIFGEKKDVEHVINHLLPKYYEEPLQKRAGLIFINGLKIRKNLYRGSLWNCIEYLNRARRELMGIICHGRRDDPIKYLRPDRGIEKYLNNDEKHLLMQTYPKLNSSSISKCTSIIISRSILYVEHLISKKTVESFLNLEQWFMKYSDFRKEDDEE